MKRRRFLSITALICALSCVLALFGCSGQTNSTEDTSTQSASADPVTVRVGSLSGPTTIGMVSFMEKADAHETNNTYEFTVSGAADEIVPSLINGDLDIALVPANVAATVYNKTDGGVSVIDINTLGVLYVVTADDSIKTFDDLAGKTIYMTGRGQTPEYVMNFLLSKADIKDQVTIEYKSEATEVVSALAADPNVIAVLPQPHATVAQSRVKDLQAVIDLNDVWDTYAGDGGRLVTGVTVVRNDFLKDHPEAVQEFLDGQSESVKTVNSDPSVAAELVVKRGIIDNADVAAEAIPGCSLVCITGSEMQDALSGYLKVLYDADPTSVGGALPGDDFYWLG